ncbi:hypothetical protein [Acrocarpospora corrugata]|uniref:hypothetical protein n=1 Tax=Acrocarpospora corrugata TaxID=35763 RepID=UPI0012D2DB92|nr:hypothetical protein [Acrocarpospora corrugata]
MVSYTGVSLTVVHSTSDPALAMFTGLAVTVLTFATAALAVTDERARTPTPARDRGATRTTAIALVSLLCAVPLLIAYPTAAPIVSALTGIICTAPIVAVRARKGTPAKGGCRPG